MDGTQPIQTGSTNPFGRLVFLGLVLFLTAVLTALPLHFDADKEQVLVYKAYADDDGDDGDSDDGGNDGSTSGTGDDDRDDRSSSAQNDRDDDAFDDMDDLDPVSAEDEAGLIGNWK